MLNCYSKKILFNKKFNDICLQNTLNYIRNFTKENKKIQTILYYDNKYKKLMYKDEDPIPNYFKKIFAALFLLSTTYYFIKYINPNNKIDKLLLTNK
jgi:hypothetical protein